MPYCAFTSTTSTWEARAFADCSQSSRVAFILCGSCVSGRPLHRCTTCFHKFQTTLTRRLPLIERQLKAQVVKRPEINALLTADFKALDPGCSNMTNEERPVPLLMSLYIYFIHGGRERES